MALLEIPLRNDIDHYEFSIDLDGSSYIFEIVYNDRVGQWSITIKDTLGNVIVGALPLLINTNLIDRFAKSELPQGTLTLVDVSTTNIECGKTDLGTRCKLFYEEAS